MPNTESNILVRKINFKFPDDIELYAIPAMPRISLYIAAFSLTMPYLEPYLIRMMLKARDVVTDEKLLEDMNRFAQQEGNHFRNHARLNQIIRSKFSDRTATDLLHIENQMKADYERFLAEESLAYNLAYAEGFEAMTCAAAMAGASRGNRDIGLSKGWEELLDWHGLEEIEHRTVAFDVFEAVVGKYPYRLIRGLKSQYHFLNFVHRFYVVMLKARGLRVLPYISFFRLAGGHRYINSLFPWYNPANYKITDEMKLRLEKYTSMAESA